MVGFIVFVSFFFPVSPPGAFAGGFTFYPLLRYDFIIC